MEANPHSEVGLNRRASRSLFSTACYAGGDSFFRFPAFCSSSVACFRVTLVRSRPPSIRANSSARSFAVSDGSKAGHAGYCFWQSASAVCN